MKAIPTTIDGKIVYSRPLNFGQLEELEDQLKEMFTATNQLSVSDFDPSESIPILRKQANIIGMGMKNYNPKFKEARLKEMSMQEISQNFPLIVSGSGLVEVEEEKP